METDLKGKIAWITGGGSGVGRAVAHALAKAGAQVYISGRRREPLDEAVSEIVATEGLAHAIACDVADPESTRSTIGEIMTRHGCLNIYVGAAGYNINRRQFSNLTAEEAGGIIATNLGGAFNASSAALAAMREARDGLLVHIGSWSGRRVRAFSGPAYTAAKAGLLAMSESLNLEVALQGIRSTVIIPGGIDTPLLDNLPTPLPPEQRAKLLRPSDCADAVLWVARLPARVRIDEITITPTIQNV